ncbi:Protein-export membrane protein SecG [Buchnera aphidicola (Thelaxes suberi)]|uniref:preprotein translocase subunit SecG n=1 Tax=Buchnera aphidicola TaxID=9 RepID=UPI0034644910
MNHLILISFIFISLVLIFLIIMQSGKDENTTFYGSANASMNLLKINPNRNKFVVIFTGICAFIFFITTIFLCRINIYQQEKNILLSKNDNIYSQMQKKENENKKK